MKHVGRVLIIALIAAALIGLEITLVYIGAYAHDVYQGVYSPSGRLCCGGDPVTGDCEGLADDDIHFNADGSVVMRTHRYGGAVIVPKSEIIWMAIPADKGVHAGHWCGKPRVQAAYPITESDPDPQYHTFCAWISPGGV